MKGIYNMEVGSLEIDKINRGFTFYVPENITDNPKLVFVLHGSTMTVNEMLTVTGHEFNRLADFSKNTIIVYPQGYGNYWNDCRKSATYKTHILNLNEFEFFRNIVSKIENDNNIKLKSIFVVGFSNGGQLVYKLAKENPKYFRGFAAISASLPIVENDNCLPVKEAVSILIANGTSDPINPFNGGEVTVDDGEKRGKVLSTPNTVKYWKELLPSNKIVETNQEVISIHNKEDSLVTIESYNCVESNRTVEYVKIYNGGHNVPNPSFIHWPEKYGNVNKDINLPKVILDFFDAIS